MFFWFFGFYVLGFRFWLGVFKFFKFFRGGLLWGFDFDFLVSFCFCFSLVFFMIFVIFVIMILIVVAYCTQLLSQAMYNLMMAAMAETCSC